MRGENKENILNSGLLGAALSCLTEVCVWKQDEYEGDLWETGCKQAFCINEGKPSENGMKFCCYCGLPLEEEARELEDPEEKITSPQ